MTIAESFYTWITADSSIDALVGDRIFPDVIPPSVTDRPALTWELEVDNEIELLDGTTSATNRAEFRVNAWAFSYKAAHDLADTVRTQWRAVSGTFGAHTAIRMRVPIRGNDGPGEEHEPNRRLYRVIMRLEIAYR